MGLLKSILNVAVKAATDAIKEKMEAKEVKDEKSSGYSTSYGNYKKTYTSEHTAPEKTYNNDDDEILITNDYFEDILRTEFTQFTIEKQVPVTNLAGFASEYFQLYENRPLQAYKAEWGQPYTFVLKKAGIPVGVLMTGYGSCHSRQVKYLISRMYAKKMGLPYISFYLDMRNRREYVIDRIRKFMNA